MWTSTAQLQQAVSGTDTQVKTQGQPGQLAAGDVMQIDGEQMVVASVAGSSTYNVQRGTSGQAVAHASGATVYQYPNPTNQNELNSAWCGSANGWQQIGGVWMRPATVA